MAESIISGDNSFSLASSPPEISTGMGISRLMVNSSSRYWERGNNAVKLAGTGKKTMRFSFIWP
jgi:hypothetical protein